MLLHEGNAFRCKRGNENRRGGLVKSESRIGLEIQNGRNIYIAN